MLVVFVAASFSFQEIKDCILNQKQSTNLELKTCVGGKEITEEAHSVRNIDVKTVNAHMLLELILLLCCFMSTDRAEIIIFVFIRRTRLFVDKKTF